MLTIDTSALMALNEKIQAFSEKVQGEVSMSGTAAMARVIYDAARDAAPVSAAGHWFHGTSFKKNGTKYWFEPGNLQKAVYRVYSPEQSNATLRIYRISWNHKKAPYGYMVEFGTSRTPAQPFMRPAMAHAGAAITAGKVRMAEKLTEIKGAP